MTGTINTTTSSPENIHKEHQHFTTRAILTGIITCGLAILAIEQVTRPTELDLGLALLLGMLYGSAATAGSIRRAQHRLQASDYRLMLLYGLMATLHLSLFASQISQKQEWLNHPGQTLLAVITGLYMIFRAAGFHANAEDTQ